MFFSLDLGTPGYSSDITPPSESALPSRSLSAAVAAAAAALTEEEREKKEAARGRMTLPRFWAYAHTRHSPSSPSRKCPATGDGSLWRLTWTSSRACTTCASTAPESTPPVAITVSPRMCWWMWATFVKFRWRISSWCWFLRSSGLSAGSC